jgi:hypothetical protein
LTYNPHIAKEYSDLNLKNYKNNDTIMLPFFDDFSKNNTYPDTSLWLDRNVYINNNFGYKPPTIGVATFDIINMAGEVYPHASSEPFIADYLTSKPINLSYLTTPNNITMSTQLLFYYETAKNIYHPADSLYYKAGNTFYNCMYFPTTYNTSMSIYFGHNRIDVSDSLYYFDNNTMQYVYIQRLFYNYFSVADSIYLSFYYQAKGNGGNFPDATDSLVLEFKTPETNWKHIWSVKGSNDTTFKRAMIPIKDSTFLKKGFQFRFYNYASLGSLSNPSFASNVDFWNIDYVYLNIHRHINDTIFPDVALTDYIRSFIKEPYTSIPWKHYMQIDTLQIDTIRLKYYNYSSDIVNVRRILKIKNLTTQQLIKIDSLGNENINPHSFFEFKRKTSPNYFPDNNYDESIFKITTYLSAPALQSFSYMEWNDTLNSYQVFKNFYAIDDGSVEYGIGLAGSGSQNGQMAMLFRTLIPDTLRGVYMYFNRTLNNASQKYFYLTIWSAKNGKPHNIIYKKEGFKPQYHGINEFHYYSLDTAIFVKDSIFIGWTQTTQDLLNLGFDLNYDYSNKTFYKLSTTWQQLPYKGTLMIRPVFSQEPIIGIENNTYEENIITVFPNPCNEYIFINSDETTYYQIFDLTGKILMSGNENKINISSLSKGLYFILVKTQNISSIHKIIKN